jgi:hypothetical protein
MSGPLVLAHRSGLPGGRRTHAAVADRPSRDPDAGVRLVLASTPLLILAVACHVTHLHLATAVAAVAVGLCLGCLVLPPGLALASAACAWAYLDGFVVHDAGQLVLAATDLRLAALLGALAAASSGTGRVVRGCRRDERRATDPGQARPLRRREA